MHIASPNNRTYLISHENTTFVVQTKYNDASRWYIASLEVDGMRRLNRYALTAHPKVSPDTAENALWVGAELGNEQLLTHGFRVDGGEYTGTVAKTGDTVELSQTSVLSHPGLGDISHWGVMFEKHEWNASTGITYNYTVGLLCLREMLWMDGYWSGYAWRSKHSSVKGAKGIEGFEVATQGEPPTTTHPMTTSPTSLYLPHPAGQDCLRIKWEDGTYDVLMTETTSLLAETQDFANPEEDAACYWSPPQKRGAHGEGWVAAKGDSAVNTFTFGLS